MNVKTVALIIAGWFFLGMGAVGLLLPIWPTTPFVLCAAGCFSVSPRLRNTVQRIPFFRAHIENYRNRRGLSGATVRTSLLFLWGMMLLSCIVVGKLWLVILLGCIGIAVTIHILMIARPRPERAAGVRGKE